MTEADDHARSEARRTLGRAGVARALADHLQHRASYYGRRYVAASRLATPSAAQARPNEPLVAAATGSGPATSAKPRVTGESSPRDDRSSTEGGGKASDPRQKALRAEAATWTAGQKLEYLRTKNVGDCRRCPLASGRRHIVFGVGNPEADLMFVGEAPGAEEDRRGEPFVGAAGQRLTAWIESFGLTRSDVYIANVLKCRPPHNRDPQPQEVATCSPFLRAQIRVIQPKVIVALGRFAGNLLCGRDARLGELRRRTHTYLDPSAEGPVPLVVTYHPSYVLRTETDQRRSPVKTPRSTNDMVLMDLTRAVNLVKGAVD
ncbi:MAG: uracil-DNA glycosylase [Myxococcales bacterium FL481]|nr:MAG: uracil-DNA glycosylase [Myxococcales bacterium FL481]